MASHPTFFTCLSFVRDPVSKLTMDEDMTAPSYGGRVVFIYYRHKGEKVEKEASEGI